MVIIGAQLFCLISFTIISAGLDPVLGLPEVTQAIETSQIGELSQQIPQKPLTIYEEIAIIALGVSMVILRYMLTFD